MNKFVLLLCFLLLLNYSNCEETPDYEQLYNYLIKILQGLCPNEEAKCANLFITRKSQVFPLFKSIVSDIRNGDDVNTIISRYWLDILSINNLIGFCNLLNLGTLITILDNEKSVQELGDNVSEKSQQIYSNIQLLKGMEDLENKLFYVGRILSLATNFTVK